MKYMTDYRLRAQHGDVTVYIALLVLGVIMSSALLFTLILTKQLRSTENVLDSERAFYAAGTGLEQGLYGLSPNSQKYDTTVSIDDGGLAYDGTDEGATFKVTGNNGNNTGIVCLESTGTFHNLTRNIKLGAKDCQP